MTVNEKADGYHGIWYMNRILENEYRYKYSGGLGTYCAKHKPFAVYCEKVNKTFFCYGGAKDGYLEKFDVGNRNHDAEKNLKGALHHLVGYFDHETGLVPKPTILLDKCTTDAHDNPVISVDDNGYIWIFSTSHGIQRPSYIHKSCEPYDIEKFELVKATKLENGKPVPMTNFSYLQVWNVPGRGFICFFTKYKWGAERTSCFMSSEDGVNWSEWQRLAAIQKGHYQVSGFSGKTAGAAFNYHPDPGGLDCRTNLYYMQTTDSSNTWTNVDGEKLELPLKDVKNPALVYDYEVEGKNVYMKDIKFDENDNPVILYITSEGYRAGPENGPRIWTIAHWSGVAWNIYPVSESDSNYDMGSLYIEKDSWRIVGPTQTGPQPFNPGGEMAIWESRDKGKTWTQLRQITHNSERNHSYARSPVNAHDAFYALWADGHGRKPSVSNLFFCNREGDVFQLPEKMDDENARPELLR